MEIEEVLKGAEDTLTVGRVFGQPYETDGIAIIPAARLRGGGGGGHGEGPQTMKGTGGGFGVVAYPVGAYVVKDGTVRWQPAIDVNRGLLVVGALGAFALFVGQLVATRRTRTFHATRMGAFRRLVLGRR